MAAPLVAVIMVNWNTARETLECVESVLKSDYPYFSVLVVDNGSRTEELEILRSGLSKRVELLALDTNYGYVGGVNRGLKRAEELSPEYFLVMNNDTVLDKSAISELVQTAIRHQNKCIVTGIVYDYYQPDLVQKCGSHYAVRRRLIFKPYWSNKMDPGFKGDDIEMDMIDDVFWLMHVDVFKDVGYYCNYFWFNAEQADYALRAVKKGFKLVFTPRAKIWHQGSISIGGKKQNPVREYFDIKAKLIFRYRHLGRLYFLFYYLEMVGYVLKLGIKFLVRKILRRASNSGIFVSKLLGLVDFTRWMFGKNPDRGHYPAILDQYPKG